MYRYTSAILWYLTDELNDVLCRFIMYTIDDNGLVSEQSQLWTKSASEALRERFTPSIFPPLERNRFPSSEEPPPVTHLTYSNT
mmetsp:Transcript_14729/g.26753  ORF Transcript_14729/g.26753 Transcript_14729/m.26753 type:complete len:84 (-) Transcript_14729:76-327(-)